VAARQLDHYPGGVFFISLAPLQSVAAIVPTIAQVLNFRFQGGEEPEKQLLEYLRPKRMLLVLDNVEHLLGGHLPGDLSVDCAGLAADILRAAPEVRILATSQAALNVQGESLYPVSGMSYPVITLPSADRRSPSPAPGRGELAEDALRHSAVRLFVDGARRAQPGFELSVDNVADVARICRLVDGMPLAILLAAAWLRVLAPAEIADQIAGDMRLDFLASGQRDLPERQRSMRAVCDHSWNLLPEGQQAVLEVFSVFRGGCTREAAQEVTGASLRDLLSLVDRSLLQRTAATSARRVSNRFEMHELLRQYAAEKLERVPSAYQAARDRRSRCTSCCGSTRRKSWSKCPLPTGRRVTGTAPTMLPL
jgi:predicted ATPase